MLGRHLAVTEGGRRGMLLAAEDLHGDQTHITAGSNGPHAFFEVVCMAIGKIDGIQQNVDLKVAHRLHESSGAAVTREPDKPS